MVPRIISRDQDERIHKNSETATLRGKTGGTPHVSNSVEARGSRQAGLSIHTVPSQVQSIGLAGFIHTAQTAEEQLCGHRNPQNEGMPEPSVTVST